jgi:hypothetical protein
MLSRVKAQRSATRAKHAAAARSIHRTRTRAFGGAWPASSAAAMLPTAFAAVFAFSLWWWFDRWVCCVLLRLLSPPLLLLLLLPPLLLLLRLLLMLLMLLVLVLVLLVLLLVLVRLAAFGC